MDDGRWPRAFSASFIGVARHRHLFSGFAATELRRPWSRTFHFDLNELQRLAA